MAVKRPPNTWVSQVLTLKGFRDEVYSEIDGSLVGYIKDGKFVQTIKELPKLDPKKTKPKDPGYVARLKESQAKLAINILRQSAVYFKELAEDVQATPAKRAEAEAKLKDINTQIETRSKEVGQAVDVQTTIKKENDVESAKKRSDEIQVEFDRLQKQREAVLNPGDPKAERIKKQQYVLAKEYAKLRQVITQKFDSAPISDTAAFGMLNKTLTKGPSVLTEGDGPTGAAGPTGTNIPPAPQTTPKVTSSGTGNNKASGTGGGNNNKTSSGGYTAEQAAALANTVGGTNYFSAKYGSASGPSGASGASGTVSGYDALLAKVKAEYNLPDIIFSNVESLGKILAQYVNGEIDLDRFRQNIENDTWYRQNSKEIKARYLQQFNYKDLVKSGNAQGTTDYEQSIAKITNTLIAKARTLGAALDEGQAKLIAEDLYIHNQDLDDSVVTRRLVSGIRPISGMIAGKVTEGYSGQALKDYQGLQALAKANGFNLSDILPRDALGNPMTAEGTLKGLALGEIDSTRIAQDVRKLAAIGQPQYVRDLLGQGYDLENIYAPYKRTMANILELDTSQIDLNDPTLRGAINEKGDMNIYDFQKALRKDSRWQYTKNAKDEVASSTLQVLRDFGFQG
jgi:RNA recognition motif-containing protein